MTKLFLENISKVQTTINQAQGKLDGFKEKAQAQADKVDSFSRERTIWALMAVGNDKGIHNKDFWDSFKEICGSEGTRNWTRTFCNKMKEHNPDLGFQVGTDAEIKATHKNIQNLLDQLEIKTVKDMKNYMKEIDVLSDLGISLCEQATKTFCGSKGNLHHDHEEKFMEGLKDYVLKFEKKDK
tara:strand:+ start:574 stop:1122 length:549 start_codon:yes stop_codon:yes gene_type:complete